MKLQTTNDRQLKTNSPLVSIVMPVYNGEKFLREAVDSVLAQTYQNFTLWIVDDVSQDSSYEIAREYERRYPEKVKAVRLKKNTNAAGNGAMNAVYPRLAGEFIARMDADDIADPTRIEKQVKFMQSHPKAVLVGTQGTIIDGTGRVTGEKTFPTEWNAIYDEYFVLHPILHPSVMLRVSLLPSKNYIYENTWGINDDYYTFFKLLQYGEFYNIPERLLSYRMHGANASLQQPKKKFMNSVKIRISAIREFGYRPSLRGVCMLTVQLLTVPLIPEKLIVPLYFALRGIGRPDMSPVKKVSLSLSLGSQLFYRLFISPFAASTSAVVVMVKNAMK